MSRESMYSNVMTVSGFSQINCNKFFNFRSLICSTVSNFINAFSQTCLDLSIMEVHPFYNNNNIIIKNFCTFVTLSLSTKITKVESNLKLGYSTHSTHVVITSQEISLDNVCKQPGQSHLGKFSYFSQPDDDVFRLKHVAQSKTLCAV